MNHTSIQRLDYGKTPDGRAVDLFVLTNRHGATCKITNFGGIVTELIVPDRDGRLGDVVLGFDSLDGYLGTHPCFGAIVGRVANRIADACFMMGNLTYRLTQNDGPNHGHGGLLGFDRAVWSAGPPRLGAGKLSLELSHTSPDGEEGYPGNLAVEVRYTFSDEAELTIEYTATTDRETPVNLTHHGTFNLSGPENRPILDHELTLNARSFTPIDERSIPTGEIASVEGTCMDFRKPRLIGSRLSQVARNLGGYDHNYVVDKPAGAYGLVARVHDPSTGRAMEVSSTEPWVQLYTGNHLDGSSRGKRGVSYQRHHGFCLEAQHFPDSVNHPGFPSTIVKPGQTYRQKTSYRFSTR